MPIGTTPLSKAILAVLFFPLFFQDALISLVWEPAAEPLLTVAKRVLFLLPAGAVIFACWLTIASLLTVIVRSRRIEFLIALMGSWWDLGRSIVSFWSGFLKFFITLATSLYGVVKVIVVGAWLVVQDFVLLPFRIARDISENVLTPGIPWIAVFLTLGWSLLEAVIFTYVTSPLVIDTFSNMTGQQLSEMTIRAPLFLFMFFIVLGSYSVLSTLAETLRSKNVPGIVKIAAIEAVAMFVEVVFLYREFVDSLVPWFAQHSSGNFQLGIVGTLFIAGLAWMGVRGLSWFLFASHGTPTIMAVIRGSGVRTVSHGSRSRDVKELMLTLNFVNQIKNEMGTIHKIGDDLIAAFVMPPLQVLAACVNFCTLIIITEHLFHLPFRSMDEVMTPHLTLHAPKRERRAA